MKNFIAFIILVGVVGYLLYDLYQDHQEHRAIYDYQICESKLMGNCYYANEYIIDGACISFDGERRNTIVQATICNGHEIYEMN